MNLKITTLSLLLAGSIGLIGCDDNDSKHSSDIIQQAFETKYPGIAVHDWEYKNGYSVAEFVFNGHEAEAWFDAQGQWYMTETDYGRDLNQLPQNIQESFRQCSYATWSIDDIDMFEYPTQQTAYVFDLEQGDRDYVLTIYADGSIENDRMPVPSFRNLLLWDLHSPKAEYWYRGASVIISAENFRKIGGWCEDYFLYAEDLDLFVQCRKHSLAIKSLPSTIFHRNPAPSPGTDDGKRVSPAGNAESVPPCAESVRHPPPAR